MIKLVGDTESQCTAQRERHCGFWQQHRLGEFCGFLFPGDARSEDKAPVGNVSINLINWLIVIKWTLILDVHVHADF